MTLVERFEAYAADFERTFVDDDWSRLEQYFTRDAVYSTPANGLRTPTEQGNEVQREWAATFTVRGAPTIHIGGSERAVFRGDRIELLEVTISGDTLSKLMKYAETYVAGRSTVGR